ncbi:MAG: Dabb family protein [Clostridia bacterium]|nr:Dabb family protein [Clostridia bacterium]
MFRHIVLYRLKNRTEEAKKALKDRFLTLWGNVPQIKDLEVGTDCLFSGRSYDVALVITFEKREDLSEYKAHPFHVSVSEYVHSVIESSVSCDYEAEV